LSLDKFFSHFNPYFGLRYLKDIPRVNLSSAIQRELISSLENGKIGRFRKVLLDGVHLEFVFESWDAKQETFAHRVELYFKESAIASTGKFVDTGMRELLWAMKLFTEMDSEEFSSEITWSRIFLEADAISLYWYTL